MSGETPSSRREGRGCGTRFGKKYRPGDLRLRPTRPGSRPFIRRRPGPATLEDVRIDRCALPSAERRDWPLLGLASDNFLGGAGTSHGALMGGASLPRRAVIAFRSAGATEEMIFPESLWLWIINHALLAVSHPYRPITDLERLHLKRAIGWFAKGNYYHACLVVGEAMLPDYKRPPMPLSASQASDFEPLSADDLRLQPPRRTLTGRPRPTRST
jgi:hypothetical protein